MEYEWVHAQAGRVQIGHDFTVAVELLGFTPLGVGDVAALLRVDKHEWDGNYFGIGVVSVPINAILYCTLKDGVCSVAGTACSRALKAPGLYQLQ